MMRLEVYRCSAKFRTINYFMVGYISQIVVQLEIKASFLSRNFFFSLCYYFIFLFCFIYKLYFRHLLRHFKAFFSLSLVSILFMNRCLSSLIRLTYNFSLFLFVLETQPTTQPGPLLWNYNNFLSLNNNNDSVYCCCWCWVDIPPIFIFIFSFPPVLLISHGLFNYYITTVYGRCYYCYYCFRRPFSNEKKTRAFELFFSFYVISCVCSF